MGGFTVGSTVDVGKGKVKLRLVISGRAREQIKGL